MGVDISLLLNDTETTELALPLLEKLEMSFFEYALVQKDKNVEFSCNNFMNASQQLLSNDLMFDSGEINLMDRQVVFLAKEFEFQEHLTNSSRVTSSLNKKFEDNIRVCSEHQIENRFYLIHEDEALFEVIGVGSSAPSMQTLVKCLSQMSDIIDFKQHVYAHLQKPLSNLAAPAKLLNAELVQFSHFPRKYRFTNKGNVVEVLSKKELVTAYYYSQGFTAKEAAKQLCLSPRTIEAHIARIKAKTLLCTRQQLKEFLSSTPFCSNKSKRADLSVFSLESAKGG